MKISVSIVSVVRDTTLSMVTDAAKMAKKTCYSTKNYNEPEPDSLIGRASACEASDLCSITGGISFALAATKTRNLYSSNS